MLCLSVKPLPIGLYRDFWIFQDGAAASWNFLNFKFVTVRMVKRVELRHHATFRADRSNRCRDMTIISFFKMAAVGYLGSVMRVGTTHEGHLVVFITVQNFVGIDAVVLIICTCFDFASLACKLVFIPPKLFWGF